MRTKFTALLLAGICFTGYIKNVAADDVYVDLSVLNDLDSGYAGQSVSQPLFPIVEKTTPKAKPAAKVKKTKVKKAKTPSVPQPKPAAPAVEAETLATEPVAPTTPTTPASPAIAEPVAAPTTTPATPATPTNETPANNNIAPASPSVATPAQPTIEGATSDALGDSISRSQQRAQKVMDDANAAQAANTPAMITPASPSAPVAPQAPNNTAQIENTEVEQGLGLTPETINPAGNNNVYAPSTPAPSAPAQPAVPVSSVLTFTDDADELTPAQQQQIDAIIGGFVDASKNKIAITSYNVEGGEDVFRRKRISLNRATGVRSYLLGKGYKNYSIKIVNVAADDNRANSVEIVELQ